MTSLTWVEKNNKQQMFYSFLNNHIEIEKGEGACVLEKWMCVCVWERERERCVWVWEMCVWERGMYEKDI